MLILCLDENFLFCLGNVLRIIFLDVDIPKVSGDRFVLIGVSQCVFVCLYIDINFRCWRLSRIGVLLLAFLNTLSQVLSSTIICSLIGHYKKLRSGLAGQDTPAPHC